MKVGLVILVSFILILVIHNVEVDGKPTTSLKRSKRAVDFLYDFFSNNAVKHGNLAISVFQWFTMTVGWFTGNLIWTAIRGDNLNNDLIQKEIVDFFLIDSSAISNSFLSMGYAAFGVLGWLLVAQLGEPSQKRTSERTDSLQNKGYIGFPTVELDNPDTFWLDLLDGTFGLFNVVKQSMVNTLLTATSIVFWIAMTYLPPRNQARSEGLLQQRMLNSEDIGETKATLDNSNEEFLDYNFVIDEKISFS